MKYWKDPICPPAKNKGRKGEKEGKWMEQIEIKHWDDIFRPKIINNFSKYQWTKTPFLLLLLHNKLLQNLVFLNSYNHFLIAHGFCESSIQERHSSKS